MNRKAEQQMRVMRQYIRTNQLSDTALLWIEHVMQWQISRWKHFKGKSRPREAIRKSTKALEELCAIHKKRT